MTTKKSQAVSAARPFGIFQEIFDKSTGATYIDPVDALFDLKPVFTRISVIAAHAHDLVQAHTPDATRALAMLNEIDLLTKDGMKRLDNTGLFTDI